ncbi:MAG: DUF6476 family protein [Brevirhabdus sp.]
MDEAPIPDALPGNLKFLRILVTILTATMIIGLLTIVGLLVMRFSGDAALPALPDAITLPDGAKAQAFTQGDGWYAVVTDQGEILIFDRVTGALRQTVVVE